MNKNDIPTININVRRCTSWKTWLLIGIVFCIGDLCGRYSMANYYNEEKETDNDNREED